MSGRRGRPPGARPPSEKDLKTPKIGQFFHQQPFAPIFQQRMGGGASQGAGSQHDHVDLTLGSGGSCSEDATSSSAQNNTPTAAEARDSLQQLLATYSDSEEEDAGDDLRVPGMICVYLPLSCARAMGARKRTMEKIQRSWIAQIRVQAGSV